MLLHLIIFVIRLNLLTYVVVCRYCLRLLPIIHVFITITMPDS